MDLFERIFEDENDQRRNKSIHGVLTAKVTGRMGSSYELRYTGMGGDAPSAPARAMMLGAGDKRGAYFMPEVGDEVVVAFDSGDPNMPIILGGVWNGSSAPPEQAKPSDTENNIRTIVSRSGHEITLDDSKAKEQIKVKTQGGHELVLDDSLPAGKVTLTTKLGAKIELDELTQSIRITAPLKVSIESAAIVLAGAVAMSPPIPAPGAPPAPPAPTSIDAPLMLDVKSPLVKIKAASVVIETTGNQLTSAVIIDGRPWSTVS